MKAKTKQKYWCATLMTTLVAPLAHAQQADCNGLGTPLSNGRFYERTTPNPNGLEDPGLSVISNVADNTGMLVGSSMRLQHEGGGGFSGITTMADCVKTASISTPTWGGSGKGYWDTDSGVQVDVNTFPTSWNNSDTLSASACWQMNWTAPGGTAPTGYEFSFQVTLANDTQVDGLYWEVLNPGGVGPGFQVYVDGVAVGSQINSPLTSGDPVSSDTGTTGAFGGGLDYYFGKIDQKLSGTHTISVVGVGNDFIMGDFAVMGCCPDKVPEPASVALLGIGGLLSLLRRRR